MSEQPLFNQLQRFGLNKQALTQVKTDGVWFHCASVGEVVTATPLIRALMKSKPDLQITVTTMTTTGSDRAKAEFGDTVAHCYLPFDLPIFVTPLLRRLKPRRLVIIEVELWPNLIRSCVCHGIAVDIVNARMTERSAARYTKFALLYTPMLHALSHVYAQGKRDAEGYLKLGLDPAKLTLSNNLKFDRDLSAHNQQTAWLGWHDVGERSVVVGGSTHSPEEALLLKAVSKLSDVLLVLVPRYPERFDEVEELIKTSGLKWQKLSESQHLQANTQVLLVDEMGRLMECYAHSAIAFVGGSIAERGGHNALEPASLGLPILMGPSRFNNPGICQVLSDVGAIKDVSDDADVTRHLTQWLQFPDRAKELGNKGLSVIKENQGALNITLTSMLNELD
ncbi:3-deoxy-D-manno-octulosonic acid transferase [Aestuariibacter salexigens]|uniref:3-deoxy-D-manno-octulosonic acid transferase n=1 Tax=Aestuariibacter salexigens TaxID=226010 RepID=UPI0012EC97C6|nr:3-deoxy-D-manno-octulosonic acid transferase [Aestuariibacter salexigens]